MNKYAPPCDWYAMKSTLVRTTRLSELCFFTDCRRPVLPSNVTSNWSVVKVNEDFESTVEILNIELHKINASCNKCNKLVVFWLEVYQSEFFKFSNIRYVFSSQTPIPIADLIHQALLYNLNYVWISEDGCHDSQETTRWSLM